MRYQKTKGINTDVLILLASFFDNLARVIAYNTDVSFYQLCCLFVNNHKIETMFD